MLFLKEFTLVRDELDVIKRLKRIHNNYYPLGIFEPMGVTGFSFGQITVFCGGNGTGKTTLLNLISEKLSALRKNGFKQSEIFEYYLDGCTVNPDNREELINLSQIRECKLLTSDDVFDYLLSVRERNSEVNRQKQQLSEEYFHYRESPQSRSFRHDSREEGSYETLVKITEARRRTASSYVRSQLTQNTLPQQSNGESALEYWEREITDHGIYLLDEPENSLSPVNQLKLKSFLEESARFYDCQLIISTHSPFLLALEEAIIYDLDDHGKRKKWQQLEGVRTYQKFFSENADLFEKEN